MSRRRVKIKSSLLPSFVCLPYCTCAPRCSALCSSQVLPKQWAQGKKATDRAMGMASSGITTDMPGEAKREGGREGSGEFEERRTGRVRVFVCMHRPLVPPPSLPLSLPSYP